MPFEHVLFKSRAALKKLVKILNMRSEKSSRFPK